MTGTRDTCPSDPPVLPPLPLLAVVIITPSLAETAQPAPTIRNMEKPCFIVRLHLSSLSFPARVKETPFASSKGGEETFHPTMTTGNGVMLQFLPCRDQVRPFLCTARITTTKGLRSSPALLPACASFPSFSIITTITTKVVLSFSSSP